MKLFRRAMIFTLSAAMLAACFGCAKTADMPNVTADPSHMPEETQGETPSLDEGGTNPLIGFVINDDGSVSAQMMMHGFLKTAQTLGYPSKLFRASFGQKSVEAVNQAIGEGCKGLLIQNPGGVNADAVKLAVQNEIKVVVPYDACSMEGLDANVVADDKDYFDELARGIAQRMSERDLQSGKILVYGRDTALCFTQFNSAIREYYPQFSVVSFVRSAAGDQAAIDALASFLLSNRDVKGMYVLDEDSAIIAVSARKKAHAMYEGGSPVPTTASNPEPSATVNPALINSIAITMFCNGLSARNLALFAESDIYALSIEPYYEVAANAAMTLAKLIAGKPAPEYIRVNRPIVYEDTVEKYREIFNSVKELFG